MGTSKVETRGYSPPRTESARRLAKRQLDKGKITREEYDRRVRRADELERKRSGRRPNKTLLKGIVGHVDDLHGVIDSRLQELDMNWSTLADKVKCSRQYLFKLCESNAIEYRMFLLLCSHLGLEPSDVVETE